MVLIIIFPSKEEIITYILNDAVYASVINLVLILLISFPFRLFTIINVGVVHGLGNTKIITKCKIASFVTNLVLVIPLYLLFGVAGALCSIVIAFIIEFLLINNVTIKMVNKHNLTVNEKV